MYRSGLVVRQVLLAVAMAAALLWGMVPVASAGDEWCEVDPVVVIHTPAGESVPVHITNYGQGAEHLALVQSATIATVVGVASGGQGTSVTINVLVRDDPLGGTFKTRTVASTGVGGTGAVYDTASGHSGKVMALQFTLNVS
jgi:hypothetical protein